jgi:hypothetical protein
MTLALILLVVAAILALLDALRVATNVPLLAIAVLILIAYEAFTTGVVR